MNSSDEQRRKNDGPEATTHKRPASIHRRDFLLSTASVGAGLVMAGKALAETAAPEAAPADPAAAPVEQTPQPVVGPPPEPKTSVDQVNIAMIGLGAEGGVLMDALLRIPNIRVKAVCDIWDYSRQRGTRTLKAQGQENRDYVDYQELLATENDLDAVIVATPDFMHAEHTIACLNKGLHVYCEKEMSNDLAKARQMVVAARETGKLLQIGHQRRSNPRYRHAIDRLILERRLLGQVTHANAQWNRAKSPDLLWPAKYEMDQATLEKYGYASMHEFRNWRWYKKYGGGPIVDLGSHQIDIFSWVFGVNPTAVIASGGIDYYKNHEWYDNVLAIFDYNTPEGVTRAFYQVLTTTGNGSHFETFMGIDGSLVISEVAQRGNHMLKETAADATLWEQLAKEGLLNNPESDAAPAKAASPAVDVRESPQLGKWGLPIELNKPAHQPHLENFFNAIRIGEKLNCPGEVGYETAVAVLKVNDAVAAARKLGFTREEFEA